jgi:hypothetical protein
MTMAVYALMAAMLSWAWARQKDRIVIALALAFLASSIAGELLKGACRATVMIMIDLAVVYGMRFICYGPRAYFVGLIGLCAIGLRLSYVSGDHSFHLAYATAINAACLAQIAIGGGWADGMGRRIDDWLHRFMPRASGLFRDVAR